MTKSDTRKIVWAYNPDLTKVDTEETLPTREAAGLVAEGRARYVDGKGSSKAEAATTRQTTATGTTAAKPANT